VKTHVTLRLYIWSMVGVLVLGSALGVLGKSMQQGQALTESTVVPCDQCGESLDAGERGNVILHEKCEPRWARANAEAKAVGALVVSDIRIRGLAEVLKDTRQKDGRPDRDPGLQ